jgi:hypothetical protein
MTGRADRWIRRTTIGCVALLALIVGTVSYLHMHALVALHGQPGWVAALTPLSVDGMIVAASTTLLADSRSGSRGGFLSWALLVIGSVASLAANVAVAEPTTIGRVIAAWPSFALIGSYELLMRQVRRTASDDDRQIVRSARAAPKSPDARSALASRERSRSTPVGQAQDHWARRDQVAGIVAWFRLQAGCAFASGGLAARLPLALTASHLLVRGEIFGRDQPGDAG